MTFAVSPSDYVNGANNSYKISITSPIEMINGDVITFAFPP